MNSPTLRYRLTSLSASPYLLWLAVLLLAFVFFKNAWVCEDAYINFRSLDQLFAGNGPNWNPNARVQVYTSALWYWLSAGLAFFYRDFFLGSIFLSAACCATAAFYSYRLLRDSVLLFLLACIIVLSQTLSDYSSSGLENPLAYALVAAFIFYMFKLKEKPNFKFFYRLCLITGLSPLVRHDFIVLLFIPFFYIATFCFKNSLSRPSQKQLFILASLLVTPLLIWTLFSLIYYGYPFPNTAYAKLNGGIPRSELIERGLSYFTAHLMWDPIIIIILLSAIARGVFTRDNLIRSLSLGLGAYLFYLIYIGSDYMLGRLLSAPTLYAILILSLTPKKTKYLTKKNSAWKSHASLLSIAILSLLISINGAQNVPLFTSLDWGLQKNRMPWPILDNFNVRFGQFRHNSLWKYLNRSDKEFLEKHSLTSFNWCKKGLKAKNKKIVVRGPIGMFGYCAGLDIIIVDYWGVTDPLLSRLLTQSDRWRPGHFIRPIPDGYIDSLKENKNIIVDNHMKNYYANIKIITDKNDLFSPKRLQTIIQMNAGQLGLSRNNN